MEYKKYKGHRGSVSPAHLVCQFLGQAPVDLAFVQGVGTSDTPISVPPPGAAAVT